ncbi:hypothetical protein [Acinetobacter towneri]|uniref:Uncharacterized protein n=1 Tax=Acinetobacter towneri TaxID=202956 RepID=A0A1E8DZ23_9GAMM|nr:hypothetical protein [Acinetobacter towneri]OFE42630.1 hypothetical protein BJN41_13275 [Acinetobacter towneri]
MKDLYTYVLASFTPTDQADIEADLILNDEPMKFLQVTGMDGDIADIIEARKQLLNDGNANDVLILHLGSLATLNDAILKEVAA